MPPLSVNFTDTSTGGPTSWSWDFGDSTVSSSQNTMHTYTTIGTYSVTLTASNSYGSDVSDATTIYVVNYSPISLIGVMGIQEVTPINLIGILDIIGNSHQIDLIGITAMSHGVASKYRIVIR
jgi:PKD repeat protein